MNIIYVQAITSFWKERENQILTSCENWRPTLFSFLLLKCVLFYSQGIYSFVIADNVFASHIGYHNLYCSWAIMEILLKPSRIKSQDIWETEGIKLRMNSRWEHCIKSIKKSLTLKSSNSFFFFKGWSKINLYHIPNN